MNPDPRIPTLRLPKFQDPRTRDTLVTNLGYVRLGISRNVHLDPDRKVGQV
jgi:hypothetical protein